MREIPLNGYIDEELWFGDEITPGMLQEALYGAGNSREDVRIILNSYGGSCNAATRMYDIIHDYPGHVHLIISGTAASAATVIAMAANRVEMTPGSLFMIHDPMLAAYGNESDLDAAINRLRVCKDSIINIYMNRVYVTRDEVAVMMKETTWMDANEAKEKGFIDGIMTNPSTGIENVAFIRQADKQDAQAKYEEWNARHRPIARSNAALKAVAVPDKVEPPAPIETPPAAAEPAQPEPEESPIPSAPETEVDESTPGYPVDILMKQLDAIRIW